MTNSQLLRDRINKAGLKLKHVAAQIGLSYYGLQLKINNETEFKASEITALSDLLHLSISERERIFFSNDVDKTSTK